jgi:hypothetical protein
MLEKLKGRWFMLLFSLPFAGVGVGLLLFSVIPSLYEWQQMKSWPQVKAQLQQAELIVNHDDDGNTYKATARYQYRYQGMDYTGERVAIMSGSDNIGSFQKVVGGQLEYALRNQQPVPAWVNPNNPSDAVLNRELRWSMLGFKMIFILVFGGVGIGLMVFTFKAKVGATDHPESAIKPWLSQQAWARAEIPCNAKNSLWFIWGFALFWNLVSLPASFAIPTELAKGNHLILIALLFPLAGIYLLVWAIRSTLSWRRFGQLVLKLDPYPGSIGGQVGGTIELPFRCPNHQRFPVALQCLRSYETGSGNDRSRSEAVLWHVQGLAESQPYLGGSTLLRLCFDIPKDLPASEPISDNYHLWRLELHAALPGVDLHRHFELPVFATGETSRAALRQSNQHPQLNEEHEAQIEAVANIEQIAGGVRMHFPMLHGWGNNLIGLIAALAFFATGLGLYPRADAPAPLVWGFILMGGGIALICLNLLFSSLRMQLDYKGLISQRYWLGIPTGRDQIPRADILKLEIASSYKTQSSQGYIEYCKIYARTRSGKKILIAKNLKGRDTAQLALEAIGSLSGYGVG